MLVYLESEGVSRILDSQTQPDFSHSSSCNVFVEMMTYHGMTEYHRGQKFNSMTWLILVRFTDLNTSKVFIFLHKLSLQFTLVGYHTISETKGKKKV